MLMHSLIQNWLYLVFLRNSKYVLAIVWLLVLLVASASCSFQRVSATTERESWLNWTRSEKFVSHDPYEPEDQDRHRDAVLKEIDSEVSRR